MNTLQENLISLLKRILISGPLILIGFYLLSSVHRGFSSLPFIFLALACFIASVYIIAPPLAKLIAQPSGTLFYPEGERENVPMYSIAEHYYKQGHYQKAVYEYKRIVAKHPDELKPYEEIIKIATHQLKDKELAETIYQEGISALKRKEDIDALHKLYKGHNKNKNTDSVLSAFDNALNRLEK